MVPCTDLSHVGVEKFWQKHDGYRSESSIFPQDRNLWNGTGVHITLCTLHNLASTNLESSYRQLPGHGRTKLYACVELHVDHGGEVLLA